MTEPNQKLPNQTIHKLLIRFFDFVASPLILAMVITFVLFWFLPRQEKFSIISQDVAFSNYINELRNYEDLNGDGETELIRSFATPSGNHSISVESVRHQILNQWNFRGNILNADRRHFTGDYNNNGLNEIYVFSQTNDTIWLHYFEPFGEREIERQNIFVDKVQLVNGRSDFHIVSPQLVDLHGDGNQIVLFALKAGYSIQPRRIYVYDIQKDSMYRSAPFGAAFTSLIPYDLDQDGQLEILANTFAPGNMRSSMGIHYSDSSAWLMAFNSNLNFHFEPVEFKGFTRLSFALPVNKNGDPDILFITTTYGFDESHHFMGLFDNQGNLIRRIDNEIKFRSGRYYAESPDKPDLSLLFVDSSGHIYSIDNELNIDFITQTKLADSYFIPHHLQIEIEGYGKQTLLPVINAQGIGFLFGKNLESYVSLPKNIANLNIVFQTFSVVKQANAPDKIFFQGNQGSVLLQIQLNRMYYLYWLKLLGIFLIAFSIFFLSRRIYRSQLERKRIAEKEMLELQFQSVSNQISPHFVFNALDAITTAIYSEKKAEAFQYGAKFTGLIRETLSNSEKISRPLENELNFVRYYLELERFRFKNNFDFDIEISEEVDMLAKVPKMIIQTFTENAFRHGIRPMKSGGKILIKVEQDMDVLHITIQDNGIGRTEAGKHDTHTAGLGLQIIDKIAMLYSRLENRKVNYTITDLTDNGQAAGTKINLWVEVSRE